MFDPNRPISNNHAGNITVQSVSPRGSLRSDGRMSGKTVDVRGRVINVRHGRIRPRRYSPIPYGGTNRRLPRDKRRSTGAVDNSGDRVVTLLVPAGAALDNLIGREVFLKISD